MKLAIEYLSPTPFMTFQTRGGTYMADANGIIKNVASRDGPDLFAAGCVPYASGIPAAPIPVFCGIGDSLMARNSSVGGTSVQTNAWGFLVQSRALLGGRFDFPIANNFGVAGTTTNLILRDQLPQALANGAGWCCVEGGVNDSVVGSTASAAAPITPAQTIANLYACYTALITAGIKVLAIPIGPRSASQWSPLTGSLITQARLANYQVNHAIRQFALTAPVGMFYVADTDYAVADNTSATGDWLTAATVEGLHPNGYGAMLMAQAVYNTLNPALPSLNRSVFSQADAWDPVYNPYGNRIPVLGQQIGSGGTASTGASGSFTTGMTGLRQVGSSLTITGSKIARPNSNTGAVMQRLTLGGGTGGATTERALYYSNFTDSVALGNPGDTITASMEITATSLVNVQNIGVIIEDLSTGGAYSYALNGTAIQGDRVLPSYSAVLQTPPQVIGAASASTTLRLWLAIDAECDLAGVSGTVDVGCMNLSLALPTS